MTVRATNNDGPKDDTRLVCFGKMPDAKWRGWKCQLCPDLVFDGCALETMREDFGKRGIAMEKVETKL